MSRCFATITFSTVLVGLCAGCGGGAGGARASTPSIFPSRDEVARIQATPLPEGAFGERVAVVDTWTLSSPVSDTIEDKPREPSAPWEKPLASAVKKRGGEVVASEAMSCIAREVAAIIVEKGAFPAMNVRRFITARCGAPSAQVFFNAWTRDVQGEVSEDKLFEETKADVAKLVEESLPKGPSAAGLWFGRVKDKLVAFTAVQPRRVRLDPMPAVPEGGKVVLRGELFEPTAFVRAVANRGRFGFSECKSDPTVALPAFSVTCEVSPDDPHAWIELAAFPPGRIVGHSVVQTMVFPAGKPSNEYRFRAAEDAPAVAPTALPAALVSSINEQRQKAGLSLLSLEGAQSRTAQNLAPYFFAAAAGQTEETLADKVVLGVRAGWDVLGTVRFGEIASVTAPASASPAQIIDLALEQPSARAALFAPETSRLAIGPAYSKKDPLVGVLFATYALLDPATHAEDAKKVIDKIVQKRAAKGLPPPALLGGLDQVAQEVSLAVSRGDETPEQGLQDFLQGSVSTLGRGLRAWVFEGATLDLLEPPKELVDAPALHFAVAVTHYKPANEPWARLVVYCVVDPEAAGAVRVAKAPAVPRSF